MGVHTATEVKVDATEMAVEVAAEVHTATEVKVDATEVATEVATELHTAAEVKADATEVAAVATEVHAVAEVKPVEVVEKTPNGTDNPGDVRLFDGYFNSTEASSKESTAVTEALLEIFRSGRVESAEGRRALVGLDPNTVRCVLVAALQHLQDRGVNV